MTASFNILDYGGVGDGVTENQDAFKEAVMSAREVGGGKIILPPGIYIVNFKELSGAQRLCVLVEDNVSFIGAGRGATIVRAAGGSNAHIFLARAKTNYSIQGITLDGNRLNQAKPSSGNDASCILQVTSATRSILRDLHIVQAFDYGIGVQLNTATDTLINNVVIENTNADAIDFKNTNHDSKHNVIRGLTVRNFGLDTASPELFAGLDIRGEVMANDIRIENVSGTRTGIRIMAGESSSGGGTGGHETMLSGYHISGTNTESSVGLWSRARYCGISNGRIESVAVGLQGAQRECSYVNTAVYGCSTGVYLERDETDNGAPLPTDPDSNAFTNLIVRDCTNYGLVVESDFNTFSNCHFRGNKTNVWLTPTAQDNVFIGGQVTAATTADVKDEGIRTVFTNTLGASGDSGFNLTSATEYTSSQTYTHLTTQDICTARVPASGRVSVSISVGRSSNSLSSGINLSSVVASGANAISPSDGFAVRGQGLNHNSASMTFVLKNLNPGITNFAIAHRVTAGTGTFSGRAISVTPVTESIY